MSTSKAFRNDCASALKQYSMEIREYPHSRSYEAIKTLAQYRGYQVGLEMVEAFQVIRKIER